MLGSESEGEKRVRERVCVCVVCLIFWKHATKFRPLRPHAEEEEGGMEGGREGGWRIRRKNPPTSRF